MRSLYTQTFEAPPFVHTGGGSSPPDSPPAHTPPNFLLHNGTDHLQLHDGVSWLAIEGFDVFLLHNGVDHLLLHNG